MPEPARSDQRTVTGRRCPYLDRVDTGLQSRGVDLGLEARLEIAVPRHERWTDIRERKRDPSSSAQPTSCFKDRNPCQKAPLVVCQGECEGAESIALAQHPSPGWMVESERIPVAPNELRPGLVVEVDAPELRTRDGPVRRRAAPSAAWVFFGVAGQGHDASDVLPTLPAARPPVLSTTSISQAPKR